MSFQRELAADLLSRYSNDLSSLAIMFPSLRARAFFNDALTSLVDSPTWQPTWTSINELMETIAGIDCGERIVLLSELFKIYKKHHPSEEFDKFYFWGDMLISDFDLIDKYMVDANRILRNINDLKELEADLSYLDESHIGCIRSFWASVTDKETLTKHKEAFLKIWRTLPAIYTEYRQRLETLGIGYPGLVYRVAAERIKRGEEIELIDKHFIVAGFNALSESERILFDYLKRSSKSADFYWDYDNYYVANSEHEAGLFLRKNLQAYADHDAISHNNFYGKTKRFKSVGCVSNIAQCKYVAEILRKLPAEERDKRTAIVLTDESLLIPLLHSIPEEIKQVNVTMGYPIKTTLAYTFIERIIDLHTHSHRRDTEDIFYHVDVTGILSHPYIVDSCKEVANKLLECVLRDRIPSIEGSSLAKNEILGSIFTVADDWQTLSLQLQRTLSLLSDSDVGKDPLQSEFIRIVLEEVTKTTRSLAKCNIKTSNKVFISLLRKHLQTITIPYEGEPLKGIQIMGILETRNIDFKNVIILSMTDATFPGDRSSQSSFIPYNLRAGYELPTPEQHEAMYAYYFYRLVQRAESVTMLYCSKADEKSTGECSRYIYQLDYESKYPVEKYSVGVDLSLNENPPIEIKKGEYERKMLERYLDEAAFEADDKRSMLSPTSLFRYVECPMKFYFASIAHLKSTNDINDTIDALTFGLILHETMEELYVKNKVVGSQQPQRIIETLRKRSTVEEAVNRNICKVIYKTDKDRSPEFSGDTLLVRDIIVKYILNGIMRYDVEKEGYSIHCLENDVKCRYPIANGRKVNIAGRADRIDLLADGTRQIIDYKSGNTPHLVFNGINNLFKGDSQERVSNIFQTMLYADIVHRTSNCDTLPSLYFASQMLTDGYSPKLINKLNNSHLERFSECKEEFESELEACLDELFDYDTPFRQVDEDKKICNLCDYNKICRRKSEQ